MKLSPPPFLPGPCASCPTLLRILDCCPRFDIFEFDYPGPILLELFWVIASMMPALIFSAMAIHVLAKRTLREILLLANLLIQHIVCAFLKKTFAQARPFGACSNSFGNPSEYSGFAAALAT